MTRWFAFHTTREGALRKENYTNSGTWPRMVRIYCRSLGDFLNHPRQWTEKFPPCRVAEFNSSQREIPKLFSRKAATWCSTLCMGHISFESTFPGKWIFLLKLPGFLLKILVLGSCEHLADWWSKPVLSTLRDGNRASLLHPYIKPPVFWGINFKLKIIDWAWLFVAFVRFVYISQRWASLYRRFRLRL